MNMAAVESGPAAQYTRRLEHSQARARIHEHRLAWLGNGRFVLVLVEGLLGWLVAVERLLDAIWLVPPLVLLAGLSILVELQRRRLGAAQRRIARSRLGLDRLAGRWPGRGIPGTGQASDDHPCAADLDLFGPGSLFERLCDASTRAGRDTLARWLLEPAHAANSVAVIRDRQAAVAELAPRLDWRDRLALLGVGRPEGINTTALSEWAAILPRPASPWPRRLAPVLAALTLGLALAWWVEVPLARPGLLLLLLAQGVFAWMLGPRVSAALAGVRGRSRDLLALRGMLVALEREPFTTPHLLKLQAALSHGGVPPSARLAELHRLLALLESPRNLFFALVAPLLLWTTQVALAIESWRRRVGPAVPGWVAAVGEAEALASLAGYAFENPADVFAELCEAGPPHFEAEGLAHPLLPAGQAVANDVCLGPSPRLLVVSGSNMSGKSTFLRSIGVAVVLAQAGGPVRARRCRLSPLVVGATLRVQDSLQAGRSRFFAEVTRLRAVLDLVHAAERGGPAVLFLLDELLAGTNSHDRQSGAAALVRALLAGPSLGLLTTHDLALTALADQLGSTARNVHFADDLSTGELRFDYRLRPGVVGHGNALALMRAIGLLGEPG